MTHFQVAEILEDLLGDGLYLLKEHREASAHEQLAIERAIKIVRKAGMSRQKCK